MNHVVLLGDSVFDNAAYVAGGHDVVKQLRSLLPSGWRATLGAVDGSVTGGVERQLGRLPPDASHLVVSAGGNDALGYASILEARAQSVAEAVDRLASVRERFGQDYERMLDRVMERRLPTAVCTIYDTRIPQPRWRLVVTALSVFNDCITRAAFARDLPVIDLRLLCDQDEDYANPIEPSVRGGEKIAAAIAGLLVTPPADRSRSVVIVR
jgi:GDSL-like Lipase/Acylhydrolase family